jgi:hypothetical protein
LIVVARWGHMFPKVAKDFDQDCTAHHDHMCLLQLLHQRIAEDPSSFVADVYKRRLLPYSVLVCGFEVSQRVFWNFRDEFFGQRGLVIDASDHYETPCVLVDFGGRQFHCAVQHLTTEDPKKTKAKRLPKHPLAIDTKVPGEEKLCDSRHLCKASPVLEQGRQSGTASTSLENVGVWARSRQGREYERSQRASRLNRLFSRRRDRQRRQQTLMAEPVVHDVVSDWMCFLVAAAVFTHIDPPCQSTCTRPAKTIALPAKGFDFVVHEVVSDWMCFLVAAAVFTHIDPPCQSTCTRPAKTVALPAKGFDLKIPDKDFPANRQATTSIGKDPTCHPRLKSTRAKPEKNHAVSDRMCSSAASMELTETAICNEDLKSEVPSIGPEDSCISEDQHEEMIARSVAFNKTVAAAILSLLHLPQGYHEQAPNDIHKLKGSSVAKLVAECISFAEDVCPEPTQLQSCQGGGCPGIEAIDLRMQPLRGGGGPEDKAIGLPSSVASDFTDTSDCGGAHKLNARQLVQASDASAWEHLKRSTCDQRPGLRGSFAQGGNTCYVAAALQCLFSTRSTGVWLERRKCVCGDDTCFSCLLDSAACTTLSPGSVLGLNSWVACLEAMGYTPGDQQDLGEFLKMLIAAWPLHIQSSRFARRCRKNYKGFLA